MEKVLQSFVAKENAKENVLEAISAVHSPQSCKITSKGKYISKLQNAFTNFHSMPSSETSIPYFCSLTYINLVFYILT